MVCLVLKLYTGITELTPLLTPLKALFWVFG